MRSAYYLKGDFGRAAETWARARDAVGNADNLVAASHWLYLSLRRAGKPAEAAAVLRPITADLDVIENGEYHQLLLMYKGERTPDALLANAGADSGGSAVRYGVSAWYLVNGRDRRSRVAVGGNPGRSRLAVVRLSRRRGGAGQAARARRQRQALTAPSCVRERASRMAPPTNSTMIESIPMRVSPVASAVIPTMVGPSTAANLPIML